ncbi:hypothetical protein FISHEDRAFT_68381 [Fistulina hepatica ATCC 64428]|uniref:Gpr1 family protein n=1 Tax=Fistulina hepatica ATCC 64428 TaxID=1128425 RepID=A0A0D7ARN8_9AGAR|nr:hypothetical protein FISHEDRAFT_68381 [Fistulina hepatica ATCC 64428]
MSRDLEKGGAIEGESSSNSLGAALRRPTHVPGSHIANPGPLGLFSFASTTFILSMYNTQVRHITEPNVVVGMAVFCGGLAQLLAGTVRAYDLYLPRLSSRHTGMWEYPRGNTFGATAFTSYGAFWMSYATILIPGSGITDAFGTDATALASALGIYLLSWAFVTFFLLVAALRRQWGFIILFTLLTITFILLAAGNFSGSTSVIKGGGVIGILTAFVAYYVGLSDLLAAEKAAVVTLPVGVFKHD